MTRLISVEKLLAKLQKQRADYVAGALDKADPSNASYEYGYKVGFNRGLMSAEQQLEVLLKEEDDGRRPENRQQKPGSAY